MVMQNSAYSGLSRRILAIVIDSMVLIVPHAIIFSFDGANGYKFSFYLLHLVINILYIGFFESSKFQGTIGKIAMNIKIVDVNNQTISFARSVFRYLVLCILSFIGVFMVNFFTILFTKEKVAVQDMFFETRVLVKDD